MSKHNTAAQQPSRRCSGAVEQPSQLLHGIVGVSHKPQRFSANRQHITSLLLRHGPDTSQPVRARSLFELCNRTILQAARCWLSCLLELLLAGADLAGLFHSPSQHQPACHKDLFPSCFMDRFLMSYKLVNPSALRKQLSNKSQLNNSWTIK